MWIMDGDKPNFLETNTKYYNKRPGERSYFFTGLVVVLLLLAGCVTYAIIPHDSSNNPEDYDPVTLEPKEPDSLIGKLKQFIFKRDTVLAGEKDDRINILLMGMGGPGHDGPYLTDTIMIASLKPSTNQVAMISIPRDLGVSIPGYGWHKINHANAYGETEKSNWGAAFATEVIEDTFDVDIQYYARIDFTAFKEVIDEVGGLSISVDQGFVDYLYPTPNDEYQTLTFIPGVQTMDGERALQYSRSRHGSNGEGSDFARARRQQKVILALKEKIFSFSTLANPIKINGIINSLDRHITTNMEFADIIAMLKLGKELDTSSVIRLVLDSSPDGYLQNAFTTTGSFILEPKSGSFKEINHLITNIFESELPEYVETPAQTNPEYQPANVEIQNGTWRAGMATRMKKKMEDRGFSISTIGNSNDRPQESSGIFSVSTSAPTDVLQGLVQELHIPIKEAPPIGTNYASSTDILIILGENFNE